MPHPALEQANLGLLPHTPFTPTCQTVRSTGENVFMWLLLLLFLVPDHPGHLRVLTSLNYRRGSKAMMIWGEGEPPLGVFPLAVGGAGRRLWTTLGCQGWNADEVGCRGYRSLD